MSGVLGVPLLRLSSFKCKATDRYTFIALLESWDPAIFFSDDLSNFLSCSSDWLHRVATPSTKYTASKNIKKLFHPTRSNSRKHARANPMSQGCQNTEKAITTSLAMVASEKNSKRMRTLQNSPIARSGLRASSCFQYGHSHLTHLTHLIASEDKGGFDSRANSIWLMCIEVQSTQCCYGTFEKSILPLAKCTWEQSNMRMYESLCAACSKFESMSH